MVLEAFLSLFCCLLLQVDKALAIPLNVSQGELIGKTSLSRNGREYFHFSGIPYGVVKYRFMEAEPAGPWAGIFDASQYGVGCLTHENCLSLNVFTPVLPGEGTTLLPVMFWIHGGAFQFGSSGEYGPEYMMDEDVVLISINYRLGVYGFFSLDMDEAPGNLGMKDMVLALKWARDNAHFFNGDKDQVTIFGESAGGVAVSLLVLSPLTQGLFHRAIAQSGTALVPWACREDTKTESRLLARVLGCEGSDAKVLKCMRRIPSYKLWAARSAGSIIPPNFVVPMIFVPTVERREPSDKSTKFLSESPIEILKKGEFQPVPFILGNNKYELGFLHVAFSIVSNDTLKNLIPFIGPRNFGYYDRPNAAEISKGIQKLYFEDITHTDPQAVWQMIANDRAFFTGTRLFGQLYASKAPTYMYFFDLHGYSAIIPYLTQNTPQHTDEMQYQFALTKPPYFGRDLIPKGHHLYEFSMDFIRLWTQFAKTGKPGGTFLSKEVMWDPYTSESLMWIHFNKDEVLQSRETDSFQRRMNFWAQMYSL